MNLFFLLWFHLPPSLTFCPTGPLCEQRDRSFFPDSGLCFYSFFCQEHSFPHQQRKLAPSQIRRGQLQPYQTVVLATSSSLSQHSFLFFFAPYIAFHTLLSLIYLWYVPLLDCQLGEGRDFATVVHVVLAQHLHIVGTYQIFVEQMDK